ncbi:MAG: hypothetical protein MI806_26555 [Minwuiales bacterium]|nr:hypothetical protein [Minwuiales bacterium]
MLLITSCLAMLLQAYPNIRPNTIATLGLQFGETAIDPLLIDGVLGTVTFYLFVVFVWYALSDRRHRPGNPRLVDIWQRSLGWPYRINIFANEAAQLGHQVESHETVSDMLRNIAEKQNRPLLRVRFTYYRYLFRQLTGILVSGALIFWLIDFGVPFVVGIFAIVNSWQSSVALIARVLQAA